MSPWRAVIAQARNPYGAWLGAVAVASGLSLLLGGPTPGTFEAASPAWAVLLWGWVLAVGGAALLVGLFWPDRLTGLLIERGATSILACGTAAYVTAAIAVLGWRAFVFPVLNVAGVAAALGWRSVQITHQLRAIQQLARNGPG